jgi:excinuclease UvrABC nuclease subunit
MWASADWRQKLAVDPPQVSFDGHVPARPGLVGCVPDKGGVYLFADFRGVLYVGQTQNLRRRFAQHLNGSHNGWLARAILRPVGDLRFYWILADPRAQAALEQHLIRAFRPLCNQAMNGH